jgi:hypothetical protein
MLEQPIDCVKIVECLYFKFFFDLSFQNANKKLETLFFATFAEKDIAEVIFV